VASGLSAPIGIVSAHDGSGRLFVVQQGGMIRILRPDGTMPETPFLDLSDKTRAGGERGLLGLAFHPDYRCNGRLFVNYTDTSGDTIVEEYAVSETDADRADPVPVARLLHIDQPFPNHNGGDLVFGPDGFLYVGMGDGGSANDPQGNGQRVDTLLGKLLRLDVDHAPTGTPYSTPADNCAGCPDGALPEIFAYGLRNPWRFSFDRATGDPWIGDVGQGRWEEVDHVSLTDANGANFGWNVMEGDHCLKGNDCDRNGLTLPVAGYDHSAGDCSITGGYVYRGSALPNLPGWYLFSDYCSGRIRAVSSGGGSPVALLETRGNIATFGEDDRGELYVADVGQGTISAIVAAT
jgi:glucose/arabinose dehydrogenase